MISPYLYDFWPFFLPIFSSLETADFLMLLRLPGDGYSLLCSKKQPPQHNYNAKRHDYNVKWHEYNVKQHDYTVKRHDYNVQQHEYNVKQHDFNVKRHDCNVRVILTTF
jgi:hypothetical protein